MCVYVCVCILERNKKRPQHHLRHTFPWCSATSPLSLKLNMSDLARSNHSSRIYNPKIRGALIVN